MDVRIEKIERAKSVRLVWKLAKSIRIFDNKKEGIWKKRERERRIKWNDENTILYILGAFYHNSYVIHVE